MCRLLAQILLFLVTTRDFENRSMRTAEELRMQPEMVA